MVFAQGYDDDDIYFNPSKVKPQEKNKVKKQVKTAAYDYPAADSYTPSTGNTAIDVDKYNRRGVFAKSDTLKQKDTPSDFANTQKIERFHNPDIIAESDDADLAALYYSQPATNINIYVANDPFNYNYWGFPYYSSWYWGYPRSWFAWNWGWNWGWGPSWSWNWGWGPSWNWGPGWGWTSPWRPGWGPSWGWTVPVRPNRPIGNVRPGYGSRPSGNYRPGNSGYRPANRPAYGVNSGNAYRPGNNSSGYRNSNRQSIRPGSTSRNQNIYNNNNNNNSYRPSYNTTNRGTSSFGSGSSGGFRGGSTGGVRGGGGGRGRH